LNLAAGDVDGSYSEGPQVVPDEPVAPRPEPALPVALPLAAVAEPMPPVALPAPILVAPEPMAPAPAPPVPPVRAPTPDPVAAPVRPAPRPAGKLTEGDLNETIHRLQSIIAAEKLLRGMGDADAYIHEVESEVAEVERLTGIPRGPSENPIDYCRRLVQRLRVPPPKPTTLAGSITPTVSGPSRRDESPDERDRRGA
jgi:hypothetical protein